MLLTRNAGPVRRNSCRSVDASASGLLLADLAWTRLTRWRELIAQIFENPVYFSHLPSITAVRIYHSGQAPHAGIWYMAAWLQQCLEPAGSKSRVRVAQCGDPCDSGLSRIEFASDSPSGLNVSVRKVEGSAAEVRVNALVNRTVFPETSDYVLLREELSIPGIQLVGYVSTILPEAPRLDSAAFMQKVA